MKKVLIALAVVVTFASSLQGGNPIIKNIFTADPSAHLFEGKVFIYPSHDQDNPDWFNMVDYHVFSSTDLVDWTDHGTALHVQDVPWAKEYMWAPDCAYKDGTYYFYFPARDQSGDFRIGVATGTSPAGPFIPEPKPIEGSFSIDPSVFIDDDGAAYMYFGGMGEHGQAKSPMVARLKANMKEFDEEPRSIEGANFFFEGAWMNKINGTYYLSYSTGNKHKKYKPSALAYATSDSPYGPFKYQGVFLTSVGIWTSHHSIININGDWYLFYHNGALEGGGNNKRSVCLDRLYFNPDGTIKMVNPTGEGVPAVILGARTEVAQQYIPEAGSQELTKNNRKEKPVKMDPNLPNVLIIGDSISIGYTGQVRTQLKGTANVIHNPGNAEGTTLGLAKLQEWLGDTQWDVIHFNWGLHDLKHVTETGENSNNPNDPQQADLATYTANLEVLVQQLKATGSKLIFATTTPYPKGVKPCRLPEDAVKYNAAALNIMQANNIQVNDLYRLALPKLETLQRRRNVHFNTEGSQVLADQVAATIQNVVLQKQKI